MNEVVSLEAFFSGAATAGSKVMYCSAIHYFGPHGRHPAKKASSETTSFIWEAHFILAEYNYP